MNVILLLALVGLCAASPRFQQLQQVSQQPFQPAVITIQAGPVAYILRYDGNLGTPTVFSYVYDQSDNQKQAVKNTGTADESLAVQGQHSFVGDDGNGFQPTGEHFPPAAYTNREISGDLLDSLAGGGLG